MGDGHLLFAGKVPSGFDGHLVKDIFKREKESGRDHTLRHFGANTWNEISEKAIMTSPVDLPP